MYSRNKQCHWVGTVLVGLLFCFLTAAQELEISVSPTPVGSGARAAGMADAFVAIADDATAASWNPAGLVQLERPECSIVGSYNNIFEHFGAPDHPEMDSRHSADNLDLNYLSFVYPLPFLTLGRNSVVSLSYQRKYDFTRDFDFKLDRVDYLSGIGFLSQLQEYHFEQDGGLSTISPAFAAELTQRLSVGVTVNFWRSNWFDDNGWSQEITVDTSAFLGTWPTISQVITEEHYEDFSGENFTLGALWTPTDRWSLGLRYDTAFTGDADYRATTQWLNKQIPGMLSANALSRKEQRSIRFPDTLALGVAHRFSDRFTLSCDITRTDWNDFYVSFPDSDGDGRSERRSLIDFSDLRDPLEREHFDPTCTVRLGGEYLFLPREPQNRLDRLWTLRGGLFYDEEPATGHPDSFFGAALGVGLLLNNRVNLDAAYQLRYGKDVNHDFIRGIDGFDEDVYQHRLLVSTVVYF